MKYLLVPLVALGIGTAAVASTGTPATHATAPVTKSAAARPAASAKPMKHVVRHQQQHRAGKAG